MKTLIAMLMILSAPVYSQSIRLFDIDTTNFPLMKAKAYIYDKDGKYVVPDKSEVSVREQGIVRQMHSVQIGRAPLEVKVSVGISIDNTTSMDKSLFGEKALELGKRTAQQLSRLLNSGSEIALQTSGARERIVRDFTTDGASLSGLIDKITATTTTRSRDYLLDQRTGIVNILKRGKHKRVAIVCTDGLRGSLSEDELQMCKDSCAAYGVKVIAIIYSPTGTERQGIKTSLRDLALSTNGYYYDGIVTQESVDHVVREIYSFLQESEPCRVEWESVRGCQSENGLRNVEMSYAGATSTADYTVASNNREYIEFSPKVATFTRPTIGKSVRHNVTLYARNASFNITGVLSSNNAFTMLPSTFSVKAGDSIVVTVEYNALDSGYAYSQFLLQSENGCAQEYYGRGGYPGISPRNSMLRITQPVGGELLLSGSDTLIRWEGVTPQDTVGLDFSTDNGITWYSIAPRAWGLQHRWRNIPDIETNKCKIRIIHYDQRNDTHENATLLKKIGYRVFSDDFLGVKNVWSPQSDKIAVMGQDNNEYKIIIAEAKTGTIVREFPGTSPNIQWSNDGKKIVIVGTDVLTVWSVETGNVLASLQMPIADFRTCEYIWSPDDKYIAAYLSDSSIVIWDIEKRIKIRTIHNIALTWNDMTWSQDGTRIYYIHENVFFALNVSNGTVDKKIVIDDLKGFERPLLSSDQKKILYISELNRAGRIDIETEERENYSAPTASDVHWSPDGSFFAIEEYINSFAILWDTKTNAQIAVLKGDKTKIESIIWSPDSKKILLNTNNMSIMYNAADGSELNRDSIIFSAYQQYNHWSANSLYLLVESRFVLNVSTKQRISSVGFVTPNPSPDKGEWSSDGNILAFVAAEGMVLWNKNFPDSLRILEIPVKFTSQVKIQWSSDNSRLSVCDFYGRSIIWDVEKGIIVKKTIEKTLKYREVIFSPKDYIVALNYGKTCAIYDIMKDSIYHEIHFQKDIHSIAWHPHGRYVALSSEDSVVIWDKDNNSFSEVLIIDSLYYSTLTWSPDGTMLAINATGNDKLHFLLWNMNTHKYQLNIYGNSQRYYMYNEILWSPDSKKIILVADYGTIYDVETGTVLRNLTLFPYTNAVNHLSSFAWSSDDRIAASNSYEGASYIWDARTGSLLHAFQKKASHRYIYTSQMLWNSEQKLLSEFDYASIKLWNINSSSSILDEKLSESVSIKIERPFWTRYPSIDIGDCIVGQTKDTMIVNFFTNTGIAPCTVKEIRFYGGYPTPSFSLISGHAPYTLASGKSHFIEVSFAPKEEGRFSGYLRLITPYNDTLQFNIIGRGVLPHLKAQDAFIDCGIVSVGNNKILADTIVLQNMIDEPITVTSIRRIFPGDSTYSIVSPDNTIVIPSNSEQKLSVKFMPLLQGRQSGEIAIYHDGIGSPFIVHLYGEGVENPSSAQEQFGEAGTKSSAHIFPNPAKTLLHCELEITQPETIQIILYSMMGEAMAELHKYVDIAGLHTFNVQLETVPSGHYYLAVRSSSALQHIPVMIMK